MNRRELLKALGLVPFVTPIGCQSNHVASVPLERNEKVAVIGAGISGLLTAAGLKKLGFRVKIFEASNRAGGRIQSHTLKNGEVVDLGASWLHGSDNPLSRFFRANHINLKQTDHYRTLLIKRDERTNLAMYQNELEQLMEVFWDKELAFELKQLLFRFLPGATPQSVEAHLDKIFDEFIHSNPGHHDFFQGNARQYLKNLFVQSYGVPFSSLGVENLAVESKIDSYGDGPFPEGESLVIGGMDQLISDLASRLDIAYRHELVSLNELGSKFKLVFKNGEDEVYDRVVLALPLPVLRNLKSVFQKLPQSIFEIMKDEIQVSHLKKRVFSFGEKFLDPKFQSYFFINKEIGDYFLVNPHLGESKTLVHVEVESSEEEDKEKRLLALIQGLFPSTKKMNYEYLETDWSDNELIKGSFVSLRLSAKGNVFKKIIPIFSHRLYLVGDYLSATDPGTMHGCLWRSLDVVEHMTGKKPLYPL